MNQTNRTSRKSAFGKIILTILLLPLGFYIWKFFKEDYQEETVAEEERSLFPDLRAENVVQVTIQSPYDRLSFLRREDGNWVIRERKDYPADNLNINNMIASIVYARVGKKMRVSAENLEELCLLPPGKGPIEKQSTHFELTSNDGRKFSAKIGGLLSSGSDISTVLGQHIDGRFLVMKDGSGEIYAVQASLKNITTVVPYWMNPYFFRPDPIKRLAYAKDGKVEWVLTRKKAATDFCLLGQEDDVFPKTTGYISYLFHNIRIDDIRTEESGRGENRAQAGSLTVETFNGNHYKIHFANQVPVTEEEKMYQQLASGFMRPSFKKYKRVIFLEDLTSNQASQRFQNKHGLPWFNQAYVIDNEQINKILLSQKELRIFERIMN